MQECLLIPTANRNFLIKLGFHHMFSTTHLEMYKKGTYLVFKKRTNGECVVLRSRVKLGDFEKFCQYKKYCINLFFNRK